MIKEDQIIKLVKTGRPIYFQRKDSKKLFGISPKTLANMAWQKRGPQYFKHGGMVFYCVDTFEAWLTKFPVLTRG